MQSQGLQISSQAEFGQLTFPLTLECGEVCGGGPQCLLEVSLCSDNFSIYPLDGSSSNLIEIAALDPVVVHQILFRGTLSEVNAVLSDIGRAAAHAPGLLSHVRNFLAEEFVVGPERWVSGGLPRDRANAAHEDVCVKAFQSLHSQIGIDSEVTRLFGVAIEHPFVGIRRAAAEYVAGSVVAVRALTNILPMALFDDDVLVRRHVIQGLHRAQLYTDEVVFGLLQNLTEAELVPDVLRALGRNRIQAEVVVHHLGEYCRAGKSRHAVNAVQLLGSYVFDLLGHEQERLSGRIFGRMRLAFHFSRLTPVLRDLAQRQGPAAAPTRSAAVRELQRIESLLLRP